MLSDKAAYPCVDYYFVNEDAVEAVIIEGHHLVQAL